MVTTTGGPQVIVQAHGDVSNADRDYARNKVERLQGLAGAPVLFARVDLRVFADPARDRPADAKASLDVNGRLVRAHVAAGSVPEAVDLLEARLRERLARVVGRRAADRSGRHAATDRTSRPGFAGTAPEERAIVAHKTFTVGSQSIDEAVDDLERLDHDFFLFRNERTNEDNVVVRVDDGYQLYEVSARSPLDDVVEPVRRGGVAPPVVEVDEAIDLLELGDLPFVFFVDPQRRRGHVLYRRYDGQYGLIEPTD
jgi:ribosome-associated translation inhibitor RaiA